MSLDKESQHYLGPARRPAVTYIRSASISYRLNRSTILRPIRDLRTSDLDDLRAPTFTKAHPFTGWRNLVILCVIRVEFQVGVDIWGRQRLLLRGIIGSETLPLALLHGRIRAPAVYDERGKMSAIHLSNLNQRFGLVKAALMKKLTHPESKPMLHLRTSSPKEAV
jgi:hypothetical protein